MLALKENCDDVHLWMSYAIQANKVRHDAIQGNMIHSIQCTFNHWNVCQ